MHVYMVKKQIEVELHPETQSLFEEVESSFPGLIQNLVGDFRAWLESDLEYWPRRFGKVSYYNQPPSVRSASLLHVHICMPPREGFSDRIPVSERKCKVGEPERDAALVYVQGEFHEERYCILALLYPNAHEKAQEEKTILGLASLARNFRDEN